MHRVCCAVVCDQRMAMSTLSWLLEPLNPNPHLSISGPLQFLGPPLFTCLFFFICARYLISLMQNITCLILPSNLFFCCNLFSAYGIFFICCIKLVLYMLSFFKKKGTSLDLSHICIPFILNSLSNINLNRKWLSKLTKY